MWFTPKEVNTQNLFMMHYWNIAAFEMATQRHLYFLIPPLHEAKVTAYLDFDGDILNSQVCLMQTAQKVKDEKTSQIPLTSVCKSGQHLQDPKLKCTT